MIFKDKSNGTPIMFFGSLDQEIFDKGILAVFERFLDFCQDSSVFNINQYYRVTTLLLNELYFDTLA
jgi:hypothetical protein